MTSTKQATHEIEGFGAVEVVNVGRFGCAVVDIAEWRFLDGTTVKPPDECRGSDRFEQDLDQNRPDVVFALYGWPGGGSILLPGVSSDTYVSPCDATFDTAWREAYQEMIDRLGSRAIVVVSTVAPFDIDLEGFDRTTRCLNATVAQLDALVFDFQAWLCPDYDCAESRDLRADSLHFNDVDTLRDEVTRSILAQVLPIADRSG
jgi:hypothetical protein